MSRNSRETVHQQPRAVQAARPGKSGSPMEATMQRTVLCIFVCTALPSHRPALSQEVSPVVANALERRLLP